MQTSACRKLAASENSDALNKTWPEVMNEMELAAFLEVQDGPLTAPAVASQLGIPEDRVRIMLDNLALQGVVSSQVVVERRYQIVNSISKQAVDRDSLGSKLQAAVDEYLGEKYRWNI